MIIEKNDLFVEFLHLHLINKVKIKNNKKTVKKLMATKY